MVFTPQLSWFLFETGSHIVEVVSVSIGFLHYVYVNSDTHTCFRVFLVFPLLLSSGSQTPKRCYIGLLAYHPAAEAGLGWQLNFMAGVSTVTGGTYCHSQGREQTRPIVPYTLLSATSLKCLTSSWPQV